LTHEFLEKYEEGTEYFRLNPRYQFIALYKSEGPPAWLETVPLGAWDVVRVEY
jgi:hypothetical protein